MSLFINERFPINSLDNLRDEIERRAVLAAKEAEREIYLTSGGVEKKLTLKQQQINREIFEYASKLVWVANNYIYTPFYWRMKMIERSKGEETED